MVGRDPWQCKENKPNILQREGYSLTSEGYYPPNAINAPSGNAHCSSCSCLFLPESAWGRHGITPEMPSTQCPLLSSSLAWGLLCISLASAWNKSLYSKYHLLDSYSLKIVTAIVVQKKVWGWKRLWLFLKVTHIKERTWIYWTPKTIFPHSKELPRQQIILMSLSSADPLH